MPLAARAAVNIFVQDAYLPSDNRLSCIQAIKKGLVCGGIAQEKFLIEFCGNAFLSVQPTRKSIFWVVATNNTRICHIAKIGGSRAFVC